MATYTTNYNLEKPAQTDIYNVDVFNANADKIDAGLTDKAEKTMLAPVETTNSASRSYAKGEYFVYNNVLCCATTAIAAGGTIAIGTNCSTAPVGGELKSLRDALSTSTASRIYYKGWSSGTASWQTDTDDIDVSQYKKILLIVMNIGATESSGIYNVEDLKVMSNLALKQSAYYDASTMAIGMIQIIDVANTILRITNTCKSNTLPCNVTVYGLK